MRRVALFVVACCVSTTATTYYVSNTGTDAQGCTSTVNPCKTLAYMNSSITLNPGDSVLLQRGGVWNEQLIPPSGGTSGSPITYDAYGTGAAPVITEAATINGGLNRSAWSYVSGNVWATSATPGVVTGLSSANTLDALQFGTIWGRKQPTGTGCANAVVSKYDFCVNYPTVYVYAPAGTNPVDYYAAEGSITPYADSLSGLPLISVANRTYLVLQHIKLTGFTYMGVSVSECLNASTWAKSATQGASLSPQA